MGVGTFGSSAFGVLASDLIEAFGIGRWQVGLLASGIGFTGALMSPVFGRLTDRIGPLQSTRRLLALSMIAMTLVATAPNYVLLLVGALVTGLPNAWCNPATNALIAANTDAKTRGLITGIKQSGVQVTAVLGGLVLPMLAHIANWRIAYGSFLILALASLIGIWRRQDVGPRSFNYRLQRAVLSPAVKWIALYGAITGLCVSATMTFLPLFAEETQGWTTSQAGFLIVTVGLVGVLARITWSSTSAHWIGHGRILRLLATISAFASCLLTLVTIVSVPSWVLVAVAILLGSGAVAWNAVGMLAVMDYSTPDLVGRGTGFVMIGHLTGFGVGAPLMGLSVDRLGSFTPGWLSTALLFGVAGIVSGRVERQL